jgi:hypothetical protein
MCLRFLVYLALWIDAAAHGHWIIGALCFVVAGPAGSSAWSSPAWQVSSSLYPASE